MRHQHAQTRLVADEALLRANEASSGAGTPGLIVRLGADIPLATLQSKTSGVAFIPFTVSMPPAGYKYRILGSEIQVVTPLASSAGGYSDAHVELGSSGANDRLIGSTDIFAASADAFFAGAGTNPYQTFDAPFEMTVTLVGSTMAQLIAGELQVNVYVALTQ